MELDTPMNGVSQNASHIMDDGKTENHASACTKWQFTGYKLDHIKNSSFPKAGRLFIDAIKKNRSCQKFLRSKLIDIEARIEEIKKLKERVQILKDFQVSCRIRTGRALSQKKDARVQLITARRTPKESKVVCNLCSFCIFESIDLARELRCLFLVNLCRCRGTCEFPLFEASKRIG